MKNAELQKKANEPTTSALLSSAGGLLSTMGFGGFKRSLWGGQGQHANDSQSNDPNQNAPSKRSKSTESKSR